MRALLLWSSSGKSTSQESTNRERGYFANGNKCSIKSILKSSLSPDAMSVYQALSNEHVVRPFRYKVGTLQ